MKSEACFRSSVTVKPEIQKKMKNAKRNQLTSGKPLNKRRMQSRPFVSVHNEDTHKNDQSAAGCANLGSFHMSLPRTVKLPVASDNPRMFLAAHVYVPASL